MERIQLVLVDDHPVVRAGLRGMLEGQTDFEIVGEASDGAQGVELARQLKPRVVLMDLQMPKMDGATATEQIHAALPETAVLVLTTFDRDADILRAIEAGAAGYLLKDAPREELFRAIRAAARGQAALSPTVATRLMNHMRAPAQENLSAREIEALQLVRQGASNKEIAKQLHISQATVKTHLLHAFAKLGVDDRTAAVTVAIERGIL
ncbi:MAG: Transcriptional regulatory protein LiaR [Anaerolineae bacterium]|nr:Transcriptional regulatory protein LiaR [Anaerolineae bacterium]RIK29081.1 MAG: DNA-binding response regulator [Chloroflexota bacterium]